MALKSLDLLSTFFRAICTTSISELSPLVLREKKSGLLDRQDIVKNISSEDKLGSLAISQILTPRSLRALARLTTPSSNIPHHIKPHNGITSPLRPLLEHSRLAQTLQVRALAAVLSRQLVAQSADLGVDKLLCEVGTGGHGMKLLQRLLGDKELHDAIEEAHDGGDVDKELFLEQLGVIVRQQLDSLPTGGLDLVGLAQKADAFVVMDLGHLVRVVFGRDGLDGASNVEFYEAELHEGDAPLHKPFLGHQV